MKKHIPNILTASNAFFGAVAVIAFLTDRWELGFMAIGLSYIADYFDGFIARMLGVSSELGKQLDSLADAISFGLLPGILAYLLIEAHFPQGSFVPFSGLILAPMAVWRLGKFNLDTRQSTSFIGMPTPACTLFFVGLHVLRIYDPLSFEQVDYSTVWLILPWVFGYLMISEFPMFSLKFKTMSLSENLYQYLLLFCGLLLLIFWPAGFASIIILLYILLSGIKNMTSI